MAPSVENGETSTTALTITRELAPVFTALMVTMRAGSAMCTELGTMRVTEQVDALVDRFRAIYPEIAVPPTLAFPGAHEALAAVRAQRGRCGMDVHNATGRHRFLLAST